MSAQPDDWLTVREVAVILGVSQQTVRNLLRRPVDPLPHWKVGTKLIRFKRAEVEAFRDVYYRKVGP